MSLLEQVSRALRRREEARALEFQELATRVAEGQAVDPDVAARCLEQAGKTADDLGKAAELHARRKALRQRLAAMAGLEKRRRELDLKIQAATARWEQARLDFQQAAGPLEAEKTDLLKELAQEDAVRRELVRTCPDATLRASLRAAEGRREEAARERAELTRAHDLTPAGRSHPERMSAPQQAALERLKRLEALEAQLAREEEQVIAALVAAP